MATQLEQQVFANSQAIEQMIARAKTINQLDPIASALGSFEVGVWNNVLNKTVKLSLAQVISLVNNNFTVIEGEDDPRLVTPYQQEPANFYVRTVLGVDSLFLYNGTEWIPILNTDGMLKAIYDANNKELNVYDMDSMDESATKKILTDIERAKLESIDLSQYQEKSEKGSVNGYASLDEAGKVPASQLPSFVDDIIDGYYTAPNFYSDVAETILIVGESGKIYINLKTNKSYRWSGTVYVKVDDADLGEAINNAPNKAVPIGADKIGIWDSISGLTRGLTFTNLLAFLGLHFRPLYDRLNTVANTTGGTYTFSIKDYETWRVTMTVNTVYSVSNLPPTGFTKTYTIQMTGNFSPTWPVSWSSVLTGNYSGTALLNTIVVEYVDGTLTKVSIIQEG